MQILTSAVVLTKNEEKNIAQCLESLKWCEEVIVIDDDSQDKTVDISKKLGAKVFIRSLNGNFSEQRNFGSEKASGDWILFVDADERVSPELEKEIMNKINNPLNDVVGFFLKRRDFIWNKELKYGETTSIKLLRLAKKGYGKWVGKVHEKWLIREKTDNILSPLIHYPHQSVAEFLRKINFYTDIRSRELFEQGKKTSWISIILYPTAKFMVNYLFKLGIADGIYGFMMAIFMSLHSFLIRGKLWLLWQKK